MTGPPIPLASNDLFDSVVDKSRTDSAAITFKVRFNKST
jgi:hypothetical protein